jgi:2-C-methyl-D-erythritol 4-phosphate cytidylyltransferase/2-C-methyl-D-erythritol 2,4-cyclodiphosphate synthase
VPAVLAILAAGNSSRAGVDKVLADLGGHPVLAWSLQAGQVAGCFREIIVVAPAETIAAVTAVTAGRPGVRVIVGGATRTASTWAAVDAAGDADVIAVHDAARPFVPPSLFQRCVEIARTEGSAVAGLPLADTVRRANEAGAAREEIEREGLWAAQTPQVFRRDQLEKARAAAGEDGPRRAPQSQDHDVRGSRLRARARGEGARGPRRLAGRTMTGPRAGIGYDIHRLAADRRLVLGGVAIEHPTGLAGHSDGDVLLHALMDALLGAANLGDLGRHFPSDDPAYAGASSLGLLKRVGALIREAGFAVASLDATVIAQAPRLAPHIGAMRDAIAGALGVESGRVSVKATTNDGLGVVGSGEAIAALAIALLD